jgi:hypothetical protein
MRPIPSPPADARGAGFAPGRDSDRDRRGRRLMYVWWFFSLFALGFVVAMLGGRVDR